MRISSPSTVSAIQAIALLARCLAVAGMVILVAGFSTIEVEFISADVPPSEFKIRQAKLKGLPAPEGVPGLPVTASLTTPEGNGPFPAVVMFPTTGGWRDTPRHLRSLLNVWGYVTLEVGAEDYVPETFEPSTQVLDAIGALTYLRRDLSVDGDRIAIVGWSLGAETALWAVDAAGWAGKHQHRFAAAVALYPYCDGVGRFFAPALIFSAELDDIVRPSSCENLVQSVPPGFRVPDLEIMAGAYHWFDLPHRPARTFEMKYEYNARATEAAVDRVRAFLEEHL